ncbi:MAG: GH92 family glycosyl hydrolase [Candidatus Eisenbacteria bacterium]
MRPSFNRICYLALCVLVSISPAIGQVKQDPKFLFADPFIGTGGHGHTYPGATMPFGMVQVSPDTRLTGWDGCSAYHFTDSVVYGFSHTHLSGTGCSDYGDILLMPGTGRIFLNNGAETGPDSGYASRFTHGYPAEGAGPGYYMVHLDDYDTDVELTCTDRAAMHRYSFYDADSAWVVLDLEHRDELVGWDLRTNRRGEVEGFRQSRAWAKDQYVYFVIQFSRPFDLWGPLTRKIDKPTPVSTPGINEKFGPKAWFLIPQGGELLVKVGISAVDVEGARKNLEAELPGWDFQGTREAAERRWNDALKRIEITGGAAEEDKTVFYTALYHALLCPNLWSDVDGRYRGMDNQIHQAEGHDVYTVFSLWDTYRASHPLFAILEPTRTLDFMQTFLRMYEEGGHLPVWELAANETWTMIGYHAVPAIVDAYAKGIRGFDTEKMWKAILESAESDREGLAAYRANGYLPSDEEGESVSRTLEYAYDDWCVARMADMLGKGYFREKYLRRAQYWKNLFDPSTKFFRGKAGGRWHEPFDPTEVNFLYTEANAWQYRFCVPQDVSGLIERMGGDEAFIHELDLMFDSSSEMAGREQSDISGMIGQYAHGNEPSHHMAYLYSYAGAPWKTQRRVRTIMDSLYTTGPEGLSGNEDCGQMSAWYVFSALGFYPVTPGSTIYVIGSPLFPEATVRLPNGNRITIRAEGVSEENVYIQSATLQGEPYTKAYLTHEDLMAGGDLEFVMGPAPNESWGTGGGDRPVQSIDLFPITPVPYVAEGDLAFADSTKIVLAAPEPEAAVYYTLDGREPNAFSKRYEKPIVLRESATLKSAAWMEGRPQSKTVTARFAKIPGGRTIELGAEYSPQYTGGGALALIDGVRGKPNFRTGAWQGYEGVDVEATVTLGGVYPIRRVAVSFLEDVGAWILFPKRVEIEISTNGTTWETLLDDTIETEEDYPEPNIREFAVDGLGAEAAYVRLRAKSMGDLPQWHRGAGGKAWVFVDEIAIE